MTWNFFKARRQSRPSSKTAGALSGQPDGAPAADVFALRKRASTGDSAAQFRLGEMYDSGRGVAQSHAEAVRWLRAAATQGHVEAQAKLGEMYLSGRSGPGSVSPA